MGEGIEIALEMIEVGVSVLSFWLDELVQRGDHPYKGSADRWFYLPVISYVVQDKFALCFVDPEAKPNFFPCIMII